MTSRVLSTFYVFCMIIASNAGAQIKIYSRPAGYYSHNAGPDIKNVETFNPKSPLTTVKMFDAQYQTEESYRGVWLKELMASPKKLAHDDCALLKFENGMQIPILLFGKNSELRSNKIFLAFEWKEDGKWIKEFPSIVKAAGDGARQDPRPLKFSTNKVVSNGVYQHQATHANKEFSPWFYADSLKEIEFVNKAAYEAQLDIGLESSAKRGFQVFQSRCQYCHGVAQVGASFGWDFVVPLPIYKHKDAERLFNHVKYPKWDVLERGLMMPPQKNVQPKEMGDLWNWSKVVATEKLKAYKPPQ